MESALEWFGLRSESKRGRKMSGNCIGSHAFCLFAINWADVDRRDEGLVLITPEESGKVVKRDVNNNPPRIASRQATTIGVVLIT